LTDLRSAPTDSPHILLIGGAGYIGSHMLLRLAQARWRATTLDDLSSGHASAVHWGTLIAGDVGDAALLDRLFAAHRFDAVMHFAARIEVAASLAHPLEYYRNNVQATLTLLEAMRRHGVSRLVFSSTAATFGQPLRSPIDESHPQAPINPYGQSKRMVEQILADCDRAYGLRSICLRYFNAAGADPLGRIGECHQPETHLIPLVLQAASGRRAHIAVHGADYDTPDGTCIRDYVHVSDLCQAHWLALQSLLDGGPSQAYNLGHGQGYSVAEVIAAAQQVSGRTIAVQGGPRRPGDPARLVADARLARQALGWQPRHSDLHTLMAHAWQWEQTLAARASTAPCVRDHSPAEPAPYTAR
jgi:UDP-glucose 4-epimerase